MTRRQAPTQTGQIRNILDLVPAGVIRQSADGTIVYVNRAASEIFALAACEIEGKTSSDPIWHMVLEDGTPISPQEHPSMVTLRTGHRLRNAVRGVFGNDRSRLRWLLTSTEPILDAQGNVAEVVITFQDITQQRNDQKAIRESEERFRVLFEQSPVGVALVSLTFEIITANQRYCDFLGYTLDEIRTLHLDDVTHPDDLKRNMELQQQLGRREIPMVRMEKRFIRKDKRMVWGLLIAKLISDHSGKPLYFLGQVVDTTETHKAQERAETLQMQLLQAQKMEAIGRLAGGVAHDFNNLLTGITGNIELARGDLPPENPTQEYLEDAAAAALRAAEVTGQLLAFSRKQRMKTQVLDLNERVKLSARLLESLLGETVQLKVALKAMPATFVGDPTHIEQVVMNLAVNSGDAMPRGGTLRIETFNRKLKAPLQMGPNRLDPGDYLALLVQDSGEGIAPEHQESLFEPFFTTKPPGKGTGLGLSTVYGIVAQHKGGIRLAQSSSEGTTFEILLREVDRQVASNDPPSEETGHLKGNETLLVVEDEQVVRYVVKRVLSRLGYTLLIARNGEEALAISRSHAGDIDLMLTDVVMPGMSGYELAEILAKERPAMSVVFSSGYSEEEMQHHGQTQEFEARFLTKPHTPKFLAKTIRTTLDD